MRRVSSCFNRIPSFVLVLGVVLSAPETVGQVSMGNTPFGSFQDGPIDTVNLGNLNVEMTFPIVSKPGRATNFNYSLTYDSSVWVPKPTVFGIYAGIADPYWLMSTNVGWTSHYNQHGNYLVLSSEYDLSCGAGESYGAPFDGSVDVGTYNGSLNATLYTIINNGIPTNLSELIGASDGSEYMDNPPPIQGCSVVILDAVANGFSWVDINGIPHPFGTGTYLYNTYGGQWTAVGFPAYAADGSGYQLNIDTSTLPGGLSPPSSQQVYSITSPGGTSIASFPPSQIISPFGPIKSVINGGGLAPYLLPDRNGNTVAAPSYGPNYPPISSLPPNSQQGPVLDLNALPIEGMEASYPLFGNPAPASQLSIYNQPISMSSESYYDDSGQSVITFGYSSNVPANSPANATFQKTYSYIDESGTSRQYIMHYKYYNIATDFNCSGVQESSNGPANLALGSMTSVPPNLVGPWNIANQVRYYLADYLMLPDGREYQFSYEPTPGQGGYVTGRISSVTLPSGGSVSYSYGPVDCADGSTLSLTRKVSDASGNISTWTYTRSQNGALWTTSIQDPENNSSIYKFITGYPAQTAYGPAWTVAPNLEQQATHAQVLQASLPPTPPSFYEIVHQQFQASGQLLRETDTCYNNNCASPTAVTLPILARNITTILPSTSGSSTSTTTNETYTTVGSLASSATTDFSGNPISETDIGYQWFGPVERPVSIEKTDFQTGTLITVNYYDEPGTTVSTNNIPDHVSGYNYGNLTSTSSSANFLGPAGPDFIKTKSCKYYDTGKVQSCEDGDAANGMGGSLTTYTYDPVTGGMLQSTSVTNPNGSLINGVSHSTQNTYNLNSRNLIASYDQNNQLTTYSHDMFSRLVQQGFPDGGSTTYCYTDLLPSGAPISSPAGCSGGGKNSVMVTKARTPINMIATLTQNDGLGRPIHKQILGDSAGPIYQDTSYDLLGNVFTSSNPYHSIADPTAGTTTTYHDALGRVTSQVAPDNSSSSIAYSGNTVASTDAAGNTTVATSDALGRLVQVVEPDQAITKYTYDVNSNLTFVNQLGVVANGDQPRTRQFSYDGLSRLVTSSNPETGIICYGLWSNGTCTGGYDDNGNLIYKTDARGVVTQYTYDALSRLTAKQYPTVPAGVSPTDPSFYTYDVSAGVTIPNAIGRLTSEGTGDPNNPTTERDILAYDSMGRIKQDQQFMDGVVGTGVPYILQYIYDYLGNVTSATNGYTSTGIGLTYGFDAVGRLQTVTSTWDDPTHPATLFGPPSLGDQYSPAGLSAANIGTPSSSPVPLYELNRTYDNRLRITGETDTQAASDPQPATGDITFLSSDSGSGGGICNRLLGCVYRNPDTGHIYVSLTGPTYTFVADVPYNGEYDTVVASELANALSSADGQGNAPLVSAVAAGTTVNMTTIATGTAADYPMQVMVTGPNDYPNQVSGPGLTGGSNGSPGGSFYSYGITYTPNSSIASANDSVNGNWGYAYDNLNRLCLAQQGNIPFSCSPVTTPPQAQLAWTYDDFGNYQGETLTGNTSLSVNQAGYNYNPNNQLYPPVTYDASGNMSFDGTTNTYTYDAAGRLASLNQSVGYIYDAEGRRVAKYSGGVLTNQYLLGLGGEQVTELDGNSGWLHSNAYAAGKLLATYDNVGLHFHFSDWIGNRRVQADGLGNIEETCSNLPYGDNLFCSGPGTDATEHHFTGKERDTESGLDYFGARYYASNMGRWMSPDWSAKAQPVPYAKLGNPQSLNLYGYMLNNPLGGVDADGHSPDCRTAACAQAGWSIFRGLGKALINAINFFTGDCSCQAKSIPALQPSNAIEAGAMLVAPLVVPGMSIAVTAAAPAVLETEAVSTTALLSGIANDAVQNVGPGSGAVYGTAVHSEFSDLVEASGNPNLFTEQSYLNGNPVSYGTPGSIRIDVGEGTVNAPTAAFDLKTGSATLKPERVEQIQSHLPNGSNVPVTEIRPPQ